MSDQETIQIGRRGTVVIPARLRRKYGLDEGTLVVAEGRPDGILLRPAVALPVEIYTPERIAEFLLSNAVDEEDYESAREEVRRMGLDPDRIEHVKPRGG
jgi:AbrB family looped-hinge helix DNA binding protein